MVAHGVWVLPREAVTIVAPHDLHMDLEFEDIVLSGLDRLCVVPYISPPSCFGHVQYHF